MDKTLEERFNIIEERLFHIEGELFNLELFLNGGCKDGKDVLQEEGETLASMVCDIVKGGFRIQTTSTLEDS
jgi:hypothetical protein